MSHDNKLSKKSYRTHIQAFQIELLKVQRWAKESGQRILVLFEGRDASGKGSTIKRFTEHLNPRGARVVALDKPSSSESGQWYFQRYIDQLPTAGEIVFFDRSWYNRAGVEKVMQFTNEQKYHLFLQQAPELERMLKDDGICLFKYWFSVSREKQLERFQARRSDPLKHWKLSPIDIASLEKWDDYTEAREQMFHFTHLPSSPWTVVNSCRKKMAHLNCIGHFLASLPYAEKDEIIARPVDETLIYQPPFHQFNYCKDDKK